MKITLRNRLLLINITVILLILIISFFPSSTLRIILGLPFLLFFPGHTLVTALFPKRKALSNRERIALSVGLSVAMIPLIGIILNYTPRGITLHTTLISVTIFIFITSIVAWYRQRRLAEGESLTVSLNLSLLPRRGQISAEKILSIIVVVSMLGAIGALGYAVLMPKVGERFTEFYILGPNGQAAGYPKVLKVGKTEWVIVGIINREHETASYRIEVRIDGKTDDELGPVVLKHDEEWKGLMSCTPDSAGDNRKVEFLLYRNGENEYPPETLRLWVNVEE